MFKTLMGKFTFFFWLLFVAVTVPIYLFGHFNFKSILEASEKEKVVLAINTIKPIIALNLSFNQKELLVEAMNSLFENKDIHTIKLYDSSKAELYFKSKNIDAPKNIFELESKILDPFSQIDIATIKVIYSNRYMSHFYHKILMIIVATFLFALAIFLISFLYVRDDLNALRTLANWLQQYSLSKNIKPIIQPSKTMEIRTIANVANEMVVSIAEHVHQLKSFNVKLEQRVKKETLKQRDQERLMIHQSRQAAMGEMLESIAHQWRQPLNIVGLAAVNLETEYSLGSLNENGFSEKMDIIASNINYMSDTIDDFRNFLNPNREMCAFSPKQSIIDILEILNAQLENNKIKYSIKNNCSMLLYGVENEFKQVLLVLINNAKDAIKIQIEKKHINEGVIIFSLECIDGKAVIEVKDNGGGINENIINSIFNPYFTTKFQNQGTGVGLYIAKNIIEAKMKGLLNMRNIKSGSSFAITLPLTKSIEK